MNFLVAGLLELGVNRNQARRRGNNRARGGCGLCFCRLRKGTMELKEGGCGRWRWDKELGDPVGEMVWSVRCAWLCDEWLRGGVVLSEWKRGGSTLRLDLRLVLGLCMLAASRRGLVPMLVSIRRCGVTGWSWCHGSVNNDDCHTRSDHDLLYDYPPSLVIETTAAI